MRQVADGVWQIPLAPREAVNAYVLGDVLVDAGTAGMGKKLPSKLAGRAISAHTITHAHPDHVGGSNAVMSALGVPFWAPAGEAPAVENGQAVQKESRVKGLMERGARFPKVSVARRLDEGDEIANGFTVLDTPGHSPGHVSFWRESDRVLVCGDVWFNFDFKTFRPKLGPPFKIVTVDVEQNRASQQRLINLRPDIVCFGHGPVMTGAAAKLAMY
jgi:glyoxylase-like metal-dependent hydrolase (beta-lactamase superfamily II)